MIMIFTACYIYIYIYIWTITSPACYILLHRAAGGRAEGPRRAIGCGPRRREGAALYMIYNNYVQRLHANNSA